MKTLTEVDHDFICDIQAPCFQVLTPDEVEWIRGFKTQVLFRKGESITKLGVYSSYVLFMIKGVARQFIEDESDKGLNVKLVFPGDFLGLSAIFSKATYPCSTVGLTDCQAYLLEKETIGELARQNGQFGFRIMKHLSDQISGLYQTMHDLQFKQVNGRLAGVLLRLDQYKEREPDIFKLLSRKDLAEFAGSSMEGAVKFLKNLEKDGILILKEKDILIADRPRLLKISQTG